METRIQLEADLLALLNLQPGWDGRRAPAPSSEAVAVVRRVLELANDLSEARVAPDVEGGVALYFFDSSVEEIPTDEDGLRGAVERVHKFVTPS